MAPLCSVLGATQAARSRSKVIRFGASKHSTPVQLDFFSPHLKVDSGTIRDVLKSGHKSSTFKKDSLWRGMSERLRRLYLDSQSLLFFVFGFLV